MKTRTAALTTLMSALTLGTTVPAATVQVPADAATIQAAIDLAATGDVIVLADGTYTGVGNKDLDLAGKSLVIRSAGDDPDACVIDCAFDGRVTHATSDLSLTVRGIGVRDTGTYYAFWIDTGTLTLERCWFRNMDDGAVLADTGATINAVETDFIDSHGFSGAAAYVGTGATAHIDRCRIMNNTGVNNAGFFVVGTATITNSIFVDCDANYAAAVTVWNDGAVVMTNCTVTECRSGSTGAVRVTANAIALEMTNCIVFGNERSGMYQEWGQISLDSGADIPDVNYSIIHGWTGNLGGVGNSGADPLFADPNGADDVIGTLDDDVRPAAGSPAIDAGASDVAVCLTFDLDNTSRHEDDANTADTGLGDGVIVDLGAYEMGDADSPADCDGDGVSDACAIASGSPDADMDGVPDDCVACPSDVDGDGTVGFSDVIAVLANWGACPGCPEDVDGDDAVGFSDVIAVLADWGPCS